ncbi:uncharacterized protein VTP21DRAFT_7147 [Calcarisporiella thermophila]|uniref:uncharacterized protein n=1 Tax=Calcarisporiella thermophila TaxID=911321 RepID=UPI0037433DBC
MIGDCAAVELAREDPLIGATPTLLILPRCCDNRRRHPMALRRSSVQAARWAEESWACVSHPVNAASASATGSAAISLLPRVFNIILLAKRWIDA